MSERFEGEVALVTGGARGIGYATARRLLDEGAAFVAICDRDEEQGHRAEAELGERARFWRCDLAHEDQIASTVAAVRVAAGPISVVVNNAGVNANFESTEMTSQEWDTFFAIDLKAAWLTAKYTVPDMRVAGRGSFVNVSSMHAFMTLEGFFPYGAAKAGLVGLTRSMALDYGPHGIRVNAVCPGFVRTRLVQDSIDRHDDPVAAEANMVRSVALRRIGSAEELASVIAFLASDDASYVTGTSLMVDGGLTARRAG